jgi:hypothetical protein
MSRLVRCFQTGTAAAALFALLGACGFPAPARRTRIVILPRPPAATVTIRSLTGTWEGVATTPAGEDILVLVLRQTADTVAGTLTLRDRTLASRPGFPARLDSNGLFTLVLGQSHERVIVRGRPDATGSTMSASVAGIAPQSLRLRLHRR